MSTETATALLVEAGELKRALTRVKKAAPKRLSPTHQVRLAVENGATFLEAAGVVACRRYVAADGAEQFTGKRHAHIALDISELEGAIKALRADRTEDLAIEFGKTAKTGMAGSVSLWGPDDREVALTGRPEMGPELARAAAHMDTEGRKILHAPGKAWHATAEVLAAYCSDDEARPNLTHALLDTSAKPSRLWASDSFQGAILPIPGRVRKGIAEHLHREFLKLAGHGLRDDEGVILQTTDDHVRLVRNGEIWLARRYNAQPLNWRTLHAGAVERPAYELVFAWDEVAGAFADAQAAMSQEGRTTITVVGGEAELSTSTGKRARPLVTQIAVMDRRGDSDDPLTLVIDARMVSRALWACDATDEVRWASAGPLRPQVITNGPDTVLVMPCRRDPELDKAGK